MAAQSCVCINGITINEEVFVMAYNLQQLRRVWTNKNVKICIIGNFISTLGDCFNDIAILSFIYLSTNSVSKIGWVYTTIYVAMFLASPFLGAITDKFNKRTILIISSLIQGGLIAAIIVLPTYYNILCCLFVDQILVVLVKLSIRAMIKQSVTADDLITTNSLSTGIVQTTKIVSPAAAGFIMALWPKNILLAARIVLGVDAVSFFISALIFIFLVKTGNNGVSSKRNLFEEIKDGYTELTQNRRIVWFYIYSLLLAVAGTIPFLIKVPYVMTTLGGNSASLGLVNSFIAFGAVVGAAIAPFLRRKNDSRIFYTCRGLQGASFIALGMLGNMVYVYIAFILQAIVLNVSQISEESYQQFHIEGSVIGRISSLYISSNAIVVLIMLQIGVLIDKYLGNRLLYLIAGLWFIVCSVTFASIQRKVTNMGNICAKETIRTV